MFEAWREGAHDDMALTVVLAWWEMNRKESRGLAASVAAVSRAISGRYFPAHWLRRANKLHL